MNKLLLTCAAGATMFVGTGCSDQQRDLVAMREVEINELQNQVGDLEGQLAAAQAEADSLRNQLSQTVTVDPNDQVRRSLEGTGANVTWRNGELVISMTNDILFKAGAAKLTSDAQRTLAKVAGAITANHPGQYVRIEGHTDSQPIRRTKNKWEDNWHLAGARARAVLHALIERNGFDRELVSFAGYADTRPEASNSSKSGLAQNRRVEIVVLPAQ